LHSQISLRARRRPGVAALVLLSGLALAGCGQEQAPQQPAAAPPPQVSVVTLRPRSVAITAELPGRTTASLVAEVRPQVNGIIKQRLFKEGSEVSAGDPLYQIDPASYQAAYESAAAALQKAESAIPSAEARAERYQGLSKQNAISRQELDDAAAALAQARADVASAKASLETARINLANTKITAPISGRIDKSELTEGALVTASQAVALATIRTLDPINVDVTQSATSLLTWRQAIADGRLKFNGPDVSVKLKLENGTVFNYTGTLSFGESHVSQSTGTFAVRASFPNPDRLLLPGMYVRAVIEEGVAENSFLVPQRAVTRNTKGEAVAMFVAADGKLEQRVVEVGRSVGNNWLATSGIKDGDRVVVEGGMMTRPGQQVTAVEVTLDETTGEVRSRQQGAAPGSDTTRVAGRTDEPDAKAGK